MLYIAYGSEFNSRKKYTDALLETMQSKRPEAELIFLDSETISINNLTQYTSSIGLFDTKSIVKISGLFENKEVKDYFFEHIQDIQDSDNAFIVSEEKISSLDVKKLEKSSVIIKKYDVKESKFSPSLFVFGDLLLQKNKQKLLTTFYMQTKLGTSPEEIMGILLWQIKSLCLALSESQINSGLKPFVYNKCTKSSWNKHEALDLYKTCIDHYHKSRRGGLTLQQRLELIIMTL